MVSEEENSNEDEDESGILGKLIMSAVLLLGSSLTEFGTGPAPVGAVTAIIGLAVIWGFDDEAEAVQEAT
jgi:hypothetical protein